MRGWLFEGNIFVTIKKMNFCMAAGLRRRAVGLLAVGGLVRLGTAGGGFLGWVRAFARLVRVGCGFWGMG